jgi:hypothetical protein
VTPGARKLAIACAVIAAACGSRGAVSSRGQAEVAISLASRGVVADDPARASSNRVAIQRAIEEHAGSGAHLVLPPGEIYLDRGPRYASLRFAGSRATDLVLRGDPDRTSTIVLQGDATDGLWMGIEIADGARRIALRDFRIYQGEIANPSSTQQNHLIQVTAARAITADVELDNIHFGPCIGDGLRIVGTAPHHVEDVRAHDFTMHLAGQPQAARGARSGVSIQRGFRNIELSDFYISGAKNSPIDMEPSAAAVMERLSIHDGVVDNSRGQTPHAISIAGYEDASRQVAPLVNSSLRDVVVLEGQLGIMDTEGLSLRGVTLYASGRGPMAGFADPLIYISHQNQNLVLSDVDIVRDTGAAPGPLVLVLHGPSTYTTGMRVEGGAWVSRVDPGARTPFLASFESAQQLSLRGTRLRVSEAGEGRYGIKLRSTARDLQQIELRDLLIESTDAELAAAVWIAASNQRAVDRVQLVGVEARTARYGAVFDASPGSRIEASPVLEGLVCTGCERAWKAINATADQMFPIVGRDHRTRVQRFTGTLPPEGVFRAPTGSEYVYEDRGRQLQLRKGPGEGAQGWRVVEETVHHGPCDPAIETTRIVTDGAQTYSLPDGTADRQVKRITIASATNAPRGVLRPSRLASGRALSWQTVGSVSLIWDDARKMWSILGTPDRVAVE